MQTWVRLEICGILVGYVDSTRNVLTELANAKLENFTAYIQVENLGTSCNLIPYHSRRGEAGNEDVDLHMYIYNQQTKEVFLVFLIPWITFMKYLPISKIRVGYCAVYHARVEYAIQYP